jgi:DDE domain
VPHVFIHIKRLKEASELRTRLSRETLLVVYSRLLSLSSRGRTHELPVLRFTYRQGTNQEDVTGLSDIPVREPCQRTFNGRTGTLFNFLEYPTDIVLLVVLGRLRYKLSLRDLAEMVLERGFEFTHEAVRDWEARFAPLIADQLRAKRRGQAGTSWYVDETYISVHGKWCYLYRAIDRKGNLVGSVRTENKPRAKSLLVVD